MEGERFPGRRRAPRVSVTYRYRCSCRRLSAFSLLALVASWQASAIQPPPATLDELLGDAETHVAENDRVAALRLLEEALALHTLEVESGAKVPDDFWFRHARVASAAGRHGQAVESAMRHVAATRGAGEYYGAAVAIVAASAPHLDGDRSGDLGDYEALRARLATERERFAGGFADVLESGGYGPEMVVVPAGHFYMGCPSGDYGCWHTEKPVRGISVAAFAISRHEVTFAAWEMCLAAKGCGGYRPADRAWGRGARPVVDVSWEDAQAYAAWLSTETGAAYRLPSGAEWEYAARAGGGTSFGWGASVGVNRANCDGCGSRWDGRQTAPVASFAPNPWGLYDMHGNVSEWVEDCYFPDYEGAPRNGSAWTNPGCRARVLRGGTWALPPTHAGAAQRAWADGATRSYTGFKGFRVARTVTPGCRDCPRAEARDRCGARGCGASVR